MSRLRRLRPRLTTLRAVGAAAVLATALTACAEAPAAAPAGSAGPAGSSPAPTTTGTAPASAPALRVETVAGGFDKPWDVAFLGGDRMLVTQRNGSLTLVTGLGPGAAVRPVQADLSGVYARGEGGLMGIAAYPDVATSGGFVTCQTHQEEGRPVDVRVVAWRLSADGTSAQKVRDPLVGTGDTARATIAQDRGSLGGKVLRVDAMTGGPAAGNPFASSGSAAERLISGYGHRNVQAVAVQPGTGRAWSVEHGSDVDDEVNVVVPGANYGWDPARGGETPGGYDESVPMTDLDRYPQAVPAAWSSGEPTEAASGADFLTGPQWGDLEGALAVSAQKGQKLLLMRPGTGADADRIASVSVPAELDDTMGRLRGARTGPDGALYLTTDNGTDDVILRVTRA